jgi:hypothetical protein
MLSAGLPPLPPSAKQQGVLHRPSPSNAASSWSHAHAVAAAQLPSADGDMISGIASA